MQMRVQVKGYFVLLLLLFTSLSSSTFTVTRKDEGDWFNGTGNIQCNELNAYTNNDGGCQCHKNAPTFSTENMACRSYHERAFYRLQPSGLNVSTDVSNVYAVCSRNAYCVLCSTITSTELLIKKTNNNVPLNADSDCVVNFVEIIHDCIPRCVNLKLWFASYGTDNLYLQLNTTIPLSYLKGELFQADVTCRADSTNGKLMFKYNGTRTLSDRGSFPDVPPYNQSETYCSTKKNNNTDIPIDTLIGAGAGGAVIIVFLVVLVIYFIRRHRKNYDRLVNRN